jgi:hypothetical protein
VAIRVFGHGVGGDHPDVVVLKVEGAIDRPLLDYLDDRLTSAEADGAIVVLQLDTSAPWTGRGGTRTAARGHGCAGHRLRGSHDLAHERERRRPAADVRLLAERGRTRFADGTAEPDRSGPPRSGYPGLDQTIQGWIDARGKDTSLDWDDRPLTAQDAIDLGIATEAAQSVPELLNVIDGQTVQTAAGPVTCTPASPPTEQEANEGTVNVRFDNLGPIQRWPRGGHAVDDLLPARPRLGLLRLRTHPAGFGFAGFAGVGMLGLAAYGLWVAPPWWPGWR